MNKVISYNYKLFMEGVLLENGVDYGMVLCARWTKVLVYLSADATC